MSVKKHYDSHLGNFYSWMAGDFETKQKEFENFLKDHQIVPFSNKCAIDLGAGHGVQSVSLARLGFDVKAIDFNNQLLTELKYNSKGFKVEIIKDDIRSVDKYLLPKPELIICWGDTITHLESLEEIEQLLINCCDAIPYNGKVILSFRDYSVELTGNNRFIAVKNDDTKILTGFLEYHNEHVTVTDLLYEKNKVGWEQKISSYNKVRVSTSSIIRCLTSNKMKILFNEPLNRLNVIIAVKVDPS